MKKRLITGIILALVFIPLIVFPQLNIPFKILMGLGVIVAVYELLKMFEKDGKLSLPVKIMTLVLTILMYFTISWFSTIEDLDVLTHIGNRLVILFLFIIVGLLLFVFDDSLNGRNIANVFLIILYVGFGAGSIVLLRTLGLRFIIFLFATTTLTDMFAYMIGVKIGKHKMAPNISPKKSWEGAIFGTIIATLVAGSIGFFYGVIFPSGIFNDTGVKTIFDGIVSLSKNNQLINAILIYGVTAFISIIGQIGDLVASKLKRTYEIKDFSNVFPGHGGFLDRFDSAFFASIALVFLLIFIRGF